MIVAAGAGLVGAILGARIGANAAREAARLTQAESQAAREEARDADERRHAWEVEQWHREKGVAAAEAILDIMIELDLGEFSYYTPAQREHAERTGHAKPIAPDDGALEAAYARIRRHAHAIKDESVMTTILSMADCLLSYRSIETWGGGRVTQIWTRLLRDTVEVLGAYIRGDEIPEARNIKALEATLEEYWAETTEH